MERCCLFFIIIIYLSFIHSFTHPSFPCLSFLCCICHCTYCMNDLAVVVVVGEIRSDCDRPSLMILLSCPPYCGRRRLLWVLYYLIPRMYIALNHNHGSILVNHRSCYPVEIIWSLFKCRAASGSLSGCGHDSENYRSLFRHFNRRLRH